MADVTDREIEQGFMGIWEQLDPKKQRKALRGSMRKEATLVRKAAVSALASSGILARVNKPKRQNSTTSMATLSKGIFQRVYPSKYGLGFMVSVKVGKSGNKGFHTNRRGEKKPVLMWAAEGTSPRRVGKRKAGRKARSWSGKTYRKYKRMGHSTGKMPRYGFMEKAEAQTAGGVENRLWEQFLRNIERLKD